jgi:5''-3'' exonuclease (including N-terminal domain of PolI)
MGIKNGYELLSKCGQEISLSELTGAVLAIDMMTYVVRLYKIYSKKQWYKKVLEFINGILKHNIKCICIFDGINKPPEKLACIQNRKRQARTQRNFPSREEIKDVMILLDYTLNCEVYIANGEAENLCCYFLKSGKATHVLSEDSDVILYGAIRFITKFDGRQGRLYELDKILYHHNLNFEELFCLCILLGTDYNNCGLEGYGFAKGYRLIKTEGVLSVQKKLMNFDRMKDIFTPSPLFSKVVYDDTSIKTILKLLL